MLAIPSLFAAMTIAGAFWVGVLAARRLRDWGDSSRMIDEERPPLALAAASSAPTDDGAVGRVRDRVAERLTQRLARGEVGSTERAGADQLEIESVRNGDVVVVEGVEADLEGDYVVEGSLRLRDGGRTTIVLVVADGPQRWWLVGASDEPRWQLVQPVEGHGLSGEPPRNIDEGRTSFGLERRAQASAAGFGQHGRPDLPRVSTYLYRAGANEVLWLERWDREVFMGRGRLIPRHAVSFLPGS